MTDRLATVAAAFDDRAPTYDESAMHRGLADAVAVFVSLDGVGGESVVVDVATGTGLVLRALLERRATTARLAGVDVSPGMLAVARRHLPGAALLQADAAALPFPDTSVDLVTCVTALHIVPDPAAVLREWARVLRPGGRAVTATFQEVPGRTHPGRRPYPTDHSSFATPELLAAAAAPTGLTLTRHTAWAHGEDRLLIAELTR